MANKLTESQRIEVARDYHFTGMKVKDICAKYNVSINTPRRCSLIFDKEYFKREKENEYAAIVIKKGEYDRAILVLNNFNVHIVDNNNIIIEQQYKSKL